MSVNWLKKNIKKFALLLAPFTGFILAVPAVKAQIGNPGLLLLNPSVQTAVTNVGKKAAGLLFQGIGDIGANVIAWVVFVLMAIIGFFVGLVVMIETWMVSVILQLNTHIVDSQAVVIGFDISRSIVNLGFVLAIVVIAIMTILRSQTYGIKQTLWRLIVAALLINFSLLFASIIMNFANQLTNFFLNSPQLGSGPVGFASRLSGAFNPHKFLLINGQSTLDPETLNSLQGVAAAGGEAFAKLLIPIATAILVVLNLIAIVVTLAVFVFMLLIRYITLSILLVLMPFAWLMWIFSSLRHLWTKWWSTFIRWVFFAPIVLFFLFLAIKTQETMDLSGQSGAYGSLAVQFTPGDPNTLVGAISTLMGTFLAGILSPMLQMFVVLGLTIGGLYTANRMSIMGASAGITAATRVGTAFGGYVGRRGKQAGTAALRTQAGKQVASGLQKAGANRGFLGRLTTLPARYAGRGLAALGTAGAENAVKDAENRQKGMTTNQLAQAMTTFTAPERIAALKRLKKEGDLNKVENLEKYTTKEDEFNRYGEGGTFKDLEKGIGFDQASRKAVEDLANAIKSGAPQSQIDTLRASLQNVLEPFVAKLSAKDVKNGLIPKMFIDPATAAAQNKTYGLSQEAFGELQHSFTHALNTKGQTATLSSVLQGVAEEGTQPHYDTVMQNNKTSFDSAFNQVNNRPPTPQEVRDGMFSKQNWNFINRSAARGTVVDPQSSWNIP